MLSWLRAPFTLRGLSRPKPRAAIELLRTTPGSICARYSGLRPLSWMFFTWSSVMSWPTAALSVCPGLDSNFGAGVTYRHRDVEVTANAGIDSDVVHRHRLKSRRLDAKGVL